MMNRTKRELPRYRRFPYSRRGELSYEGTYFPCLIQDISAKGLLIVCARDIVVGQELMVSFELIPGHVYRSTIRVQHIGDGCFGAKIIAAGEHDEQVFGQYVEKRFKESKNGQSGR